MDEDDAAWAQNLILTLAAENYPKFLGAYNYDDFVDEGYQALIYALERTDDKHHFRHYLYVRARGRIRDTVRLYNRWLNGKAQGLDRRHHRLPRISESFPPPFDPWIRARLISAWEQLLEKEKEVVALCWMYGIPKLKCAKELGVAEMTVHRRLERAKRTFLNELRAGMG